jgi:hypothetical protein
MEAVDIRDAVPDDRRKTAAYRTAALELLVVVLLLPLAAVHGNAIAVSQCLSPFMQCPTDAAPRPHQPSPTNPLPAVVATLAVAAAAELLLLLSCCRLLP